AIGLVILWIVGLTYHATAWLTWLDLVGAIFGFIIAAGVGAAAARSATAGPIALGVGLGVLWLIAVAAGAIPWLTWGAFAFACAFFLVGVLGGLVGQRNDANAAATGVSTR